MVSENAIDPALLNAINPLDPLAGSLVMPRPQATTPSGTPSAEGDVTMPYVRYKMTKLYNAETGRVFEVYGQVAIEALRSVQQGGKNKWLDNEQPLWSTTPPTNIMYPQTGEGLMCPLYLGDDNPQKVHFAGKGFRTDCKRNRLPNEYTLTRHVEARHSRLNGFLEQQRQRELADAQIMAARATQQALSAQERMFRESQNAAAPAAPPTSPPIDAPPAPPTNPEATGPVADPYVCDECERTFKNAGGYHSHKRAAHPAPEE